VNGAGFTADPNLSVLIDGTPATNVVVYSYTVLSCNAPAGILPGPHDVTVTNRFGSATLSDGLLLTPAMFVDGVPTLGSTVYLRYEFDPLDSTFAIFGLPPQQSIPTPPFGGLLGIVPFFPLFTLASYPGDEFVVHANIPNDPALSGVTVLFQSLTGPNFKGSGKDAAWSNVAALAIQ
jgi:IPT/TIG domain-containing protein